MRLSIVGLASVLVFAGSARAQDEAPFSLTPQQLQAMRAAHLPAGQDVEVLLDETTVRFDDEGRATTALHVIYRTLNDVGAQTWSAISSRYHPWNEEKPELRARVVSREGIAFELDPHTAVDGSGLVQGRHGLYGDQRVVSAPLPALSRGAIVETLVIRKERQPAFRAGTLRRVTFYKPAFVALSKLRVEYPSTLPLTIRARGGAPSAVVNKRGAVRSASFVMRDLLPPASMPAVIDPDSSVVPSVDLGTAPSWNAVASAYAQLVDTALQGFDAGAVVRGLLQGNDDEAKKIARLVAYTHEQVRYTGLEVGERAIVPASPAEVLARHYGDCKDKSTLLVGLLRAAGFDASLALLASGHGPDLSADVPGFGLFDHAIVRVRAKQPVWIDATLPLAPPGVILYEDQDRSVLIASKDTRELTRTPRTRAIDNEYTTALELEFPQRGNAAATFSVHATGAMLIPMRPLFMQSDEQLSKLYARTAADIGAKQLHVEATMDRGLGKSVTLSTGDARKLHVYDDGGSMRVAPAALYSHLPTAWLESWWPAQGQAAPREPLRTPFYVDRPHRSTVRYRARVADGFSWQAMPEPLSLETDGVSLRCAVRVLSPREVEVTFQLDVEARLLSAQALTRVEAALHKFEAEATSVLHFVHDAQELLNQHKLRAGVEAHRALAARHPGDAVVVSRYARAVGHAGLVGEARRVAAQLREQQPKSAHAHWTYGEVMSLDALGRRSYYSLTDLTLVERSYRQAIALDPSDSTYASSFANVSLHLANRSQPRDGKRVDELFELYRKLWAQDDYKEVGIYLAKLYFLRGQYREAIQQLEKVSGAKWQDGLWVASLAAEQGLQAAQAKAEELAAAEPGRPLKAAITLLVAARRYDVAASLASLPGVPRETAEGQRIFAAAQRHDACAAQLSPAARAVYQQLSVMLREVWPITSTEAYARWEHRTDTDRTSLFAAFQRSLLGLKTLDTSFAPQTELTTAAAPCHYQWAVEERAGAASVTLTPQGELNRNAGISFYLRRTKQGYRLFGAYRKGQLLSFALGITAALDEKKLDEARVWLAWARKVYDELEHARTQGDDRQALHLLWPQGEASEPELRLMAALFGVERADARSLAALDAGVARFASQPEQANIVRWHRALALRALQPSLAADALAELRKQLPDEKLTWQRQLTALLEARRFPELERELDAYDARYPEQELVIMQRNRMDTLQGRYATVLARTQARLAEHRASESELNNAAWDALYVDGDLEAAIALAEAACAPRDKAQPDRLHTLAVLQAAVGKVDEARVTLESYLNREQGLTVFARDQLLAGLIAEQFGDVETARELYRQLPEAERATEPMSVQNLAQRRLRALDAAR